MCPGPREPKDRVTCGVFAWPQLSFVVGNHMAFREKKKNNKQGLRFARERMCSLIGFLNYFVFALSAPSRHSVYMFICRRFLPVFFPPRISVGIAHFLLAALRLPCVAASCSMEPHSRDLRFPSALGWGCPSRSPCPDKPSPSPKTPAAIRRSCRLLGTPSGMSPADAPVPETFPLHHFPAMCCFESVCFS